MALGSGGYMMYVQSVLLCHSGALGEAMVAFTMVEGSYVGYMVARLRRQNPSG